MSVWALVPFKGANNAKRRLASKLSSEARALLVLAMLDDVLEALKDSEKVDEILLVSRSEEAKFIAQKWQINLYRDQAHTLVDALTEAGEKILNDYHAQTAIIVPGDVPLITGKDVDHVLGYHADVSIVPDGHKIGTNALVCTPPNAFPLVFDGRSYHPHIDAATRAGLRVRTVYSQAFALDVDVAEDLVRVRSSNKNSRTRCLLRSNSSFDLLVD